MQATSPRADERTLGRAGPFPVAATAVVATVASASMVGSVSDSVNGASPGAGHEETGRMRLASSTDSSSRRRMSPS